jgi:hypothetical protein
MKFRTQETIRMSASGISRAMTPERRAERLKELAQSSNRKAEREILAVSQATELPTPAPLPPVYARRSVLQAWDVASRMELIRLGCAPRYVNPRVMRDHIEALEIEADLEKLRPQAQPRVPATTRERHTAEIMNALDGCELASVKVLIGIHNRRKLWLLAEGDTDSFSDRELEHVFKQLSRR